MKTKQFIVTVCVALVPMAVAFAAGADEKAMRDAVAKNPELKDLAGAWDKVAQIQKVRAANAKRYNLLETGHGFNSSQALINTTWISANPKATRAVPRTWTAS